MAILTKAPRGTQDVLPADSYRWQVVEDIIRETARLYGFKEIRFPTFEHTELYQRSVGDTTDVVQKEMYTFLDKGDRSITLRPEGTAGTVRAMIEHGLLGGVLPVKAYYLTSCFRYEKPQAGRRRFSHCRRRDDRTGFGNFQNAGGKRAAARDQFDRLSCLPCFLSSGADRVFFRP